MDKNANDQVISKYFETKIPSEMKIGPCTMDIFWSDFLDGLQTDRKLTTSQARLVKNIYIDVWSLGDMKEEDEIQLQTRFWTWLPDTLTPIISPYVTEVTINFQFDLFLLQNPSSFPLLKKRMEFLLNLTTDFPKMKALRLNGNQFSVPKQLQDELMITTIKPGSGFKLECLDLDEDFFNMNSPFLDNYISTFFIDSKSLKQMSVWNDHLVVLNEDLIFQNVETLTIKGYGGVNLPVCYGGASKLKQMFPSLKTLNLQNACNSYANGLIPFINDITKDQDGFTLGLDPSLRKINDDANTMKMEFISTLVLDMEYIQHENELRLDDIFTSIGKVQNIMIKNLQRKNSVLLTIMSLLDVEKLGCKGVFFEFTD